MPQICHIPLPQFWVSYLDISKSLQVFSLSPPSLLFIYDYIAAKQSTATWARPYCTQLATHAIADMFHPSYYGQLGLWGPFYTSF